MTLLRSILSPAILMFLVIQNERTSLHFPVNDKDSLSQVSWIAEVLSFHNLMKITPGQWDIPIVTLGFVASPDITSHVR